MILIYGSKKNNGKKDTISLDETDLNIPFGNEVNEKPLSLLNQIEKTEINGEKVCHLFQYDGISLWWFMHPTIFPTLRTAIIFIEKFGEMIDNVKPSTVVIDGEFDKFLMVEQICRKKGIPVQCDRIKYLKFKTKRFLRKQIQPYRFQKITTKKIQKRLELYNSKNKTIPQLNDKIVFAVSTYYRRFVYNPKEGRAVKGEFIQGPIMQMLHEMNYGIVGIDLDYSFQGELQTLGERLNDSYNWFPLEAILGKYRTEDYEETLNFYLNMLKNEKFSSLFVYRDIKFWDYIKNEFEKLALLPHLPTYIILIESCKKLFSENKPLAIFIPYETGPLGLALIIAAKKYGIKTIGIQHGYIVPKNSDYSRSEVQSEQNPLGMPLPDLTLLFGNYAKHVLTQNGIYPQDKFLVFGQPEFFKLNEIVQSLQKTDIRKKYKISPSVKVILFTSSKLQSIYNFFGMRDYDERVFKKLLQLYAAKSDYYVVFKPHPVRGELTKTYDHLIKDHNAYNFVIVQGDLFELFQISDVVISIFSTTIIDSIVFGKPTIRMTFPGSSFSDAIDNSDVVMSCDLESLPSAVENILNKKKQETLTQKRTDFIKDQYGIPNENVHDQLRSILNRKLDGL